MVSLQAQSAAMPSTSLQGKAELPGRALFAAHCASCHGADGRGERAPNIATASEVQQLPNEVLIRIVENGIPGAGMPAFSSLGPESVKSIVDYLRVLQGTTMAVKLPGDPHRGESLFFGKAQCSTCHTVNGRGGFIASDLSLYGSHETPDTIRQVIVNPGKALPAKSKSTTVVTRAGQKITGMVRSNDNFSMALQTLDGSFHFFKKSDLKDIDLYSHSLMPDDYSSKLNNQEINDLVSYLLEIGTENASHAPKDSHTPRRHAEGGGEN